MTDNALDGTAGAEAFLDLLGEARFDEELQADLVNRTDISVDEIRAAIKKDNTELLSTIASWVEKTQPSYRVRQALTAEMAAPGRRQGGLFYRDRYLTPINPYDQMRTAYAAVEADDIVSGVADVTEALAFSGTSMFALDEDQQDALNQWAADFDLDGVLRQCWRELFTVSQIYPAVIWGEKEYKVRGKGDGGRDRRKTIKLRAPMEFSLLDPLKVVPVGSGLFQRRGLAWIATREESQRFDDILGNDHIDQDDIVSKLIAGRYTPPKTERSELQQLGIDTNNLWLLNPVNVFTHTATKAGFQRFSPVRMRSIFELLDLKQQLRQMERAHLIGAPLRLDQRIATPGGWKAIGAAKVGDRVFGPDGKSTDIIGVFPQGELSGMRRVTFTDGAEVVCDLRHPWTVSDRYGRERTIPLSKIDEEGLFSSNGAGKRVHRHRIPITAPLDLPEAELPLDPYLVGYMLGDGSFTQTIPKITCDEPEDDQPWRDVLPAGVSVSQYETRPDFCNQYGLKGSRWRFNEVTEGLREAGLWGVGCSDKYVPDEYLWASEAQRWALLQGLADSDGSSSQAGCLEITTVSEKLAAGVIHLAQSLGGLAKPCVVEAHDNKQTTYRVMVSLHQKEAPFRIRRKVAKWRPRRKPYVRAIASIEPVEDAEAVCIKVARDDGLFLTEGMVVTHNTNFLVVVTKGSDALPADPAEIAHLQSQVQTMARLPFMVGDHRLKAEIVTPKMDSTLKPERWNAIDGRITARSYGMFVLGNYCLSGDTEILTADGWKFHTGLNPDDVVLTLDTETQSSEWQACSAVNRFEHDGPMLSLEGGGHSSLSTLNHRWWVEERQGESWVGKFVISAELSDAHRIPSPTPGLGFLLKDADYADWVDYQGVVWCPTTPNSTWLARRNGTVFWTGNSAGASGDDSAKLVKVVAKGMESKRSMLRRTFERYIFRPMYEINEDLTSMPKMHYHPRAIALDFDANWADFVQRLSDKGDLSRETSLSEFDFDQDLEAELKKREKANGYDDLFKTNIPFSGPVQPGQQPALPPGRDNGGGRRNGGGRAPGSGQGQPPRSPSRRSDRGRKKPPIAAEQLTVQVMGADGEVLHEFADRADYEAWLAEEADEGEG